MSGVTASNPNGSYNAGQVIHIQVNFAEPVTVTGAPKLALNTIPGESATYASGGGTSTLVFDYTVQAGDDVATLDYAAASRHTQRRLDRRSGRQRRDAHAGRPGYGRWLGNSKSITIDTTAPTVSGVTASNANGAYKAGQTIHVQVNFSVPVNVTGSPKLALETTPAASATYASGSGSSTLVFDYTVQAGDNVARLDYTGTDALTLNGGTIRDAATNDATLTLATPGRPGRSATKNIVVDTTAAYGEHGHRLEPDGAYKAARQSTFRSSSASR